MKNIYGLILLACLSIGGLISCDNEDTITPSEIVNLTAETRSGEIILRWQTPDDGTIDFINIVYDDPRLGSSVTRAASYFADSIVIPDTRARYPEYEFTIQSVSKTGDKSTAQIIKQKSAPAEVIIQSSSSPITLSAASFSSNASDKTEGLDFGALIDDVSSTYWHTTWRGDIPFPHWLQVDLGEELTDDYFKFLYTTRPGKDRNPSAFDLQGSKTGGNSDEEWFIIKTFTLDEDNLPTQLGVNYESPILPVDNSFRYIRMNVTATTLKNQYWAISEFKCWKAYYNEVDPEDPDQDF